MRLLLLTPQRPYPPHQGTSLRNFNLIKQLAVRHQVCVLTFLEPDQPADPGPLAELCAWVETVPVPPRGMGQRLGQLFTSARPDMGWRLWSAAFQAKLAERLKAEPFDVVQLEGIEMAPYLPTIEANPPPMIVYDAHNAEWILQKRAFLADARQPTRWPAAAYSWVQWPRLKHYEAQVMRRVHHTVAMSAADEAALRQLVPEAEITVIPNGVDLAAYGQFSGEARAYDVVFTGKMDFRPNIDAMLWFGREVWPLILAQRPQSTWAIVGQRPHRRLDSLRALSGVTITGFVADVRPYIAGAVVYIAPLRMGGGTRLKLLEAMAMARPIVSTTVGAEGFAVQHNEQVLLADTPAAFAEAVLALLRNPDRREALGQAGRAFAEATYGWEALVPRLEAIYEAHLGRLDSHGTIST